MQEFLNKYMTDYKYFTAATLIIGFVLYQVVTGIIDRIKGK